MLMGSTNSGDAELLHNLLAQFPPQLPQLRDGQVSQQARHRRRRQQRLLAGLVQAGRQLGQNLGVRDSRRAAEAQLLPHRSAHL